MSDSDVSFTSTPPEIKQLADGATKQLLPEKSKVRYEAQYNVFKNWCNVNKAKVYSENVLLAYFTQLVDKKTKSLWAIYSMLRSCISLYDNLDISKYARLISFLKRKAALHKPKKSKVLEADHISSFITQAQDDNFLLMKVVLIIGLSGACRRDELFKMVISDIEFKDDILLIQIPVGINTIGSIPSKIAEFLHLENPKEFTGHCFRRSSATLLVNQGGDLLSLKRHGGWKSSSVAESYVEESLKRKREVSEMITEVPSTSKRPAIQVNVTNPLNTNIHQNS